MRALMAWAALALLLAPAFAQDPQDPGSAGSDDGKITVELNKLEPADNACHLYFIVENASSGPLADLQLDVFLIDKKGVILRGAALQFSDVAPGRPTIAPFALPDIACDDIGRLALNKVLSCTDAGGAPISDCASLIGVTSRSTVGFEY